MHCTGMDVHSKATNFCVLDPNGKKVRMIFRAKRKNDRIDARKLAFLAFMDQVPQAHIPSAERRQWRSLIEYRRRLVEKRGGTKNRVRTILRYNAIQAPRSLWSKKGQDWLSKVELGLCQSLQRDLLMLELQEVRQKIQQVEIFLQKLAAQEPAVGLLRTIPGVGIRTAEAVPAARPAAKAAVEEKAAKEAGTNANVDEEGTSRWKRL